MTGTPVDRIKTRRQQERKPTILFAVETRGSCSKKNIPINEVVG